MSWYGDGPPLTSPSTSPPCGDHNDPTWALHSLSYVIQQLSTLLLQTTPIRPSPVTTFTRENLVGALSNVVFTSLQLAALPSPTALTSSSPTLPPQPQTTPATEPAPHVQCTIELPSVCSTAAPSSSLSLPVASSSSSSPFHPSLTVRVLTPISALTTPANPTIKPHRTSQWQPRHRPRSRSYTTPPITPSPSSAPPPSMAPSTSHHTTNPFAVLSQHPTFEPTANSHHRRRHSLPLSSSSSLRPSPVASLASEPPSSSTSPLSAAQPSSTATSSSSSSPSSSPSSSVTPVPLSISAVEVEVEVVDSADQTVSSSSPALLLPSVSDVGTVVDSQATSPLSDLVSNASASALSNTDDHARVITASKLLRTSHASVSPTPLLPSSPSHACHSPITCPDPISISTNLSSHLSSSPAQSPTCANDSDEAIDDTQATQPPSDLVSNASAFASPTIDRRTDVSASDLNTSTILSAPATSLLTPTITPLAPFRARSTISITASISKQIMPADFCSRLDTRQPSHAQHFRDHFSPSSPLCECKRFPVFSSRLAQLACEMEAADGFCLPCVKDHMHWLFHTMPHAREAFFPQECWDEWRSFYMDFYGYEEFDEFMPWESEEELWRSRERFMQQIVPWLARQGLRRTCPHVVGSCRDYWCYCGIEPAPVVVTILSNPDKEQEGSDTDLPVVDNKKKKKKKKSKKEKQTAASAAT